MSDTQLKEDFLAYRAIFSGPERWTQKTRCRDRHGNPVGPRAENAFSFCLIGAINTNISYATSDLLSSLSRELKINSLLDKYHRIFHKDFIF
jgi:hypothetical protein